MIGGERESDLPHVCSHSEQALSMKTPKRMGPGMEPTHLKIMLCKPKAKLLSSSLTALKDATTLGMVAKNVRKTPMNWTMMKGMRSPQSLEQVLRSAEPPCVTLLAILAIRLILITHLYTAALCEVVRGG